MRARFALALLLVPVLLAAPATAKGKAKKAAETPPDFPAVSLADTACTPDGAFGHRFARSGHIDATAGEEWAPFERLMADGAQIRVEASFTGSRDGPDNDIARAKKFLHAFEKAVGKKDFPERKTHNNGTEFHSDKDAGSGLSLLIRQDDDRVTATCIDHDR